MGRSLVISGTQNDNDEKPPQDHDSLLLKVFLVFQEMKAAGAAPDIASYNALLKACASAGDINKAKDVFTRLTNDEQYHELGIKPNDTTWKELLLATTKASDITSAIDIWNMAVTEHHWRPNLDSLEIIFSIYT